MARDRKDERENYPDSDYLDYITEYVEMLERGEGGQARNVNKETPPQREEKAPRSNTRSSSSNAGRHQAPGRHAAPAHKPAQSRRSPPEGRRRTPSEGGRRASSEGSRRTRPERRRPTQEKRRRPPREKRRLTDREKRNRGMRVLFLVAILTLGAIYVAVNITVSRVKSFVVASATEDRQVLSWESAGGVDCYDIYDGSGTLLAEVDADAGTQYVMNGLESGTEYTYSIVAVKDFFGKRSGEAAACSAYTKPETVRVVTAANSGTGALLSWEGVRAGGYEVQYTDASGTTRMMEPQDGGARDMNVPDLELGQKYTFQVRSFVQDGEERIYSDWSSTGPLTVVYTADMTGVDVTKPMVALTFDDGPDTDNTNRILDTLKEYGVHATFFQQGSLAAELPAEMNRMVEEGHEVACHTYDHSHYGSDVTMEDIVRADDLIEQACGVRPTAFRSPGGETTDLIRQICASEGMPIYYWSIDTEDWKSRNADAVCDTVIGHVSDGDIILMHNVYSSTAEAVERIVPYLVEEGYQLVTVGQLVQAKTGEPPVPGTQYVTATWTN